MTLQRFLAIVLARKWVVALVAALSVASAIAVSALMAPRWTATASVVIDSRGPDPITGLVFPAQALPGYMATQVDIIQSQNVALKVVKALRMDESAVARAEWEADTAGRGSVQTWLADLLLKRLDVRPARESSVINISFGGSDPKFAAAVANAFAQAYIDTTLELRVEPARQTARWFSERTKTLRQDVEGSAARLAEYQRSRGIVSLDERLDTENNRLEQLNQQLSLAAAQTADAMTRQRLAREFAERGSPPDSIPEVVANQLVQSLKSDLSRQDAKLKDLATRYGANHPLHEQAAAEAQQTRARLKDEMIGIVASIELNSRIAQRREADLRAQVAAQKERVLGLKNERDELAALMREADNAQKAFDVTTQRHTQTTLESQATQTNVAILNPAVEPIRPSFPRWGVTIALALALGLALGVAAALGVEMLDERLRSPADLAGSVGVPLLAVLPATPPVRPAPRAAGARAG